MPDDFAFIIGFVNLISTASDYILLWNRQPDFRKIGQNKAIPEMTFTERLVWAATLLATRDWMGT